MRIFKIISCVAIVLMALLSRAQYNPVNPPEPGGYTVSVSALPSSGGTVSSSASRAEAGKAVTVYAYTSPNYRFSCWQDEKGDTLSKTQIYHFPMPARDISLRAVFTYTPGNPAEPVTANCCCVSTSGTITLSFFIIAIDK